MTDREITVHIGLPKTATTTIQRHLFYNAEYLSRLGVDYCADLCQLGPFAKASAHHAIARASHMPRENSFQSNWNSVIRQRISSSGTYLLSSEWFSRGNAKGVRVMMDEWDLPDQRHLLVVTRSELAYIRSHWMQGIKMGKRSDSLYEYYLANYKPRRRAYSDRLRAWLDNGFSLIALRYEELQSSADVTQSLLRAAFDLQFDFKHWHRIPNANVSPSHDTVAHYQRLMRPIHSLVAPRVDRRRAAKWFRLAHDGFCNNFFSKNLGESRQYREDLEKIKEDLTRLSDIDDLSYKILR